MACGYGACYGCAVELGRRLEAPLRRGSGRGRGAPLVIDLGGLQLEHPVLNASGTLDARSAHAVLGDATLGCAAHVTKTITPEPRAGNAAPRVAEVPGGMLNSIGLPNPGIDRFIAEVLPQTAALVDVPVIVSVGGFSHDDYVRLAGG